ncbi:MAG: nucleotidyltransferase family protein [Marinosulfonomonas sp.]|nr:nucleotidyltransferase family protein [Marinosulfonomonas sp.]
MTIPILILAAGASNRMNGRDKLLIDVGGRTLLRHVVCRAVATGGPVLVTLPHDDTKRHDALSGLDVRLVEVADASQGMAASLRAGLKALSDDAAGVLVALADMPEITTEDYTNLIKAFQADPNANIQRAASTDGTAGNPVLLPMWALNDPEIFQGDAGARHLLRQHADRVRLVPLPDNHAITDLDTSEDWAAWRGRP